MRTSVLILLLFGMIYSIQDIPQLRQKLIREDKDYSVLSEQPHFPEPRKNKSLVFNEYAQCDPGRLEWYTSLSTFTRVLGLCGFDNVRLRFDRQYSDDHLSAQTTYYFTLTDNAVSFDSLRALFFKTHVTKAETSTVLVSNSRISIPRKVPMVDLVERMNREKDRVQAYSEYAKLIHDSFMSQLVMKYSEQDTHYCFTFRITDQAYSIVGSLNESGDNSELVKHEERLPLFENSATVGAYAIGYQNSRVARAMASGIKDPLLQAKKVYAPIQITDYSVWFNQKTFSRDDKLKLFEINVTAKSQEGLRQIGIKFNGIWDIRELDGSTLATHSIRVPYSQDCVDFETKVTDIYGETLSEKNPRQIRDLEDNGFHAFDSLWQNCDTDPCKRTIRESYLKKMAYVKKVNTAKRIAKTAIKLLPLLLF